MVKSNRYSPTNKKFKSHFEQFASEKTKKGHLNDNERDEDDAAILTGVLKRINRKKMYDNGWEVEVNKKTYYCTYTSNLMSIPASTVTDNYFIPKQTCEVEIQKDKVSKVYMIVKIKDTNLTPVALYDNVVTISPNTNTNTNKGNQASISVSKTGVVLSGNVSVSQSINVSGDVVASNINTLQNKVQELESQINDTTDIQSLQEQITQLKEQIIDLQTSTEGDTNDG